MLGSNPAKQKNNQQHQPPRPPNLHMVAAFVKEEDQRQPKTIKVQFGTAGGSPGLVVAGGHVEETNRDSY